MVCVHAPAAPGRGSGTQGKGGGIWPPLHGTPQASKVFRVLQAGSAPHPRVYGTGGQDRSSDGPPAGALLDRVTPRTLSSPGAKPVSLHTYPQATHRFGGQAVTATPCGVHRRWLGTRVQPSALHPTIQLQQCTHMRHTHTPGGMDRSAGRPARSSPTGSVTQGWTEAQVAGRG